MAKQVQLRGGTSEEHREFTGASREITIDTTLNTIRVHDGITKGGHVICKKSELDSVNNTLINKLNDIQTNIGASHNHDSLYSKLVHNHDDVYSKTSHNHDSLYLTKTYLNGYDGLSTNGNDSNWIRTTKNGLIPYQGGGYSSIGANGWRFNEGWFNYLNAHTLNLSKNGDISTINFSATVNDPGFICHVEDNNISRMAFSVSDDLRNDDQFWFGSAPGGSFSAGAILTSDGKLWLNRYIETAEGSMTMGGRYIYFDGQRPSHAPEGSISFG